MKFYNFPLLARFFFPYAIFKGPNSKSVYITFDDGPHPEVTLYVLELLEKSQSKATFFCIGKNVILYKDIFQRIKDLGHKVGNHTYSHENYQLTNKKEYYNSIEKANEIIRSPLFRPPYGRIDPQMINKLKGEGYKTVLWSLLSYDFNKSVNPADSLIKLKNLVKGGDIIVFHDSEKAFSQLKLILPSFLEFLSMKGFKLEHL